MTQANITDIMKTDIAFQRGDMVKTAGGDVAKVSDLANLQQALFHRLMTVPGTLVWRPTYGVGIGNYQNSPNTFSLQQKLADLIQEEFAKEVRVQSVQSVAINIDDTHPENTTIIVRLTPVGYTELPMTFTPFSGAFA